MPYKSGAQRRFMHARHPKIASRWDEEIRAKKKKGKYVKPPERVEKSKNDWAKTLAVGTVGGALANQFPRVQDLKLERKKKAKKGQVKKVLATHEDPYFNHEAARKAFDLVMKMDDDTARMFTTIVVSDLFEETVEKNQSTLQRHLDETIAKLFTDTKQATLRAVSKSDDPDQVVAYAQALALIEKAVEWDPELHPRGGKNAGQFRTRIQHNQQDLLRGKNAKSVVGVETPKEHKGQKLSHEDRIAFQDEYRQLADFLDSVGASTGGGGNQQVTLHYKDRGGRMFSQPHAGTKPPVDDLADPSFRLVGAEAKPTTLTTGGAAFGLATALGGGMSAGQVRGVSQAGAGSEQFTNAWLGAGDAQASNQKLYGRMAAGGQFLGQIAPAGSKAQLAGKFAEIVGQHGPQAEAVLGPTARKTAYRYRGTEKTPDRQLTRAYGAAVEQAKQRGELPEEEEVLRRGAGRGTSHGSMVAAGARTRAVTPREKEGAPTALHRAAAERQATAERAPTWRERELGRQVAVQFLADKKRAPKKGLYGLHLAAGNTPPSEGVIINAEGQIATQASGYGDDHYLPFNLKNLKALKGGEYIRTRSVGGLTSEDVYTGLISGARQVTVTSRSGTYTMTFEEDFRGGRRHNDKARRMTRRYEQLLDAVQSQQVERGDIDPEMRQQIESEVKEEMSGPGWKRSDIQDEVKTRIDEFKENPYISEQDEKRAEAIISSRAAGTDDKERAKIRAEVYDDLLDQKETRFRLNSEGYRAALFALSEQFPYYIQPKYTPPKDVDRRIETEPDKGYVEPGRNRPTQARAGLYGTVKGKSGKFSAAQADYQGARSVHRGGTTEATESTPAGGTTATNVHEQRREKAAEAAIQYKVVEVAGKFQEKVKATLDQATKTKYAAELAYTAEDLKEPAKQARFNTMVTALVNDPPVQAGWGAEADRFRREWETAAGHRNRAAFDPKKVGIWPRQAPTFPDEKAYKLGADPKVVENELNKLDRMMGAGIVHPVPYSTLNDTQLEQEHGALARMLGSIEDNPDIPLTNDDLKAANIDPSSKGLAGGLRSSKDKIVQRLENIQRIRALQLNQTDAARTKREESTVQVHHNAPKAITAPQVQGATFANDVANVADLAAKEKEPDPVEVKLLKEFAARTHTAHLATPQDVVEFMQQPENEQAQRAYWAARERLTGKGDDEA